MPKFSGPSAAPPQVFGPVRTTDPTLTHEGGQGFARDAKSELFLLAVTNMVGEASFYEPAGERDERFRSLIAQVVAEDAEWVARFVPYLRDTMQMRSASVVMAAEYVKAGGPHGRGVIDSACSRADEPAEVLGYWASHYGRKFPQPVKRGVADACRRLYNERSALRYDGQSRTWRMADVIELVHPKPTAPWQEALFKYLLDKRHHDGEANGQLPVISRALRLEALAPDARRAALRAEPETLAEAGFSWERLAGWLPGGMDAEAWQAVIPSMGYMALLRNLRNFDQVAVSDEVAAKVAARLSDPEQVAKSRQFPLRFLSAWKATETMRWGQALERALDLSVANVPALGGRTLVLVDVSGSMELWLSDRSAAKRWEAAAIFGLALAKRAAAADLYLFSHQLSHMEVPAGASILRLMGEVRQWVGGGTETGAAIRTAYSGHDRVVLLTDEQSFYDAFPLPPIPRLFTFNLAGYRVGGMPSGQDGRHTFGGLTDAGFRAIELLDRGRDQGWPF
jgi:hypothetical protein